MNMTLKTSLLAGSAAILALTSVQAQEVETVEATVEATVETAVETAIETAEQQVEEAVEDVAVMKAGADAEVPTEETAVEQVAEVSELQDGADRAAQKVESIPQDSSVVAEVAEQGADVKQAVAAIPEEAVTKEVVAGEEAIETAVAGENVLEQIAEEAAETPIEVALEEEAADDSSKNVVAAAEEEVPSVSETPTEETLVAVAESPTLKPVYVATSPSELTMGELLNLSKGQFSKADINGDGALSESEFVNLSISLRSTLEENYKLPVVQETPEVADVADAEAATTATEANQVIEGSEQVIEKATAAAESQIAETPKAVAGQEFADLSEQTNSVTEDKVVAAIIASFEQSDTDNNNTIEAEELAKFAAFYTK